MKLIVIHKETARVTDTENSGSDLLRFALASEPVADLILGGLSGCLSWDSSRRSVSRFSTRRSTCRTVCAIPEEWSGQLRALRHRNGTQKRPFFNTHQHIVSYTESVPIPSEFASGAAQNDAASPWFDICNGRFATQTSSELLERVLAGVRADVVAVNVEPELLGKHEKVRLTTQGSIAGLRRLYSDSAEFAPVPVDWPHHLFVKTDVLAQVLADGVLPESFAGFLQTCRSNALTLRSINVGGTVLDLETESGLLNFCRMVLSQAKSSKLKVRNSNAISEDSRFVGKVLLGENVSIGPDVIIVGPTVIGNNVKVERGAVINSSIIGPEVCVPENQHVQDRIVKGPQHDWERPVQYEGDGSKETSCPRYDLSLARRDYGPFRTWPRFSYVRCLKRIVDFFGAMIVLILFAPLIPFVALAIRLTSPGPVFFKDRRQGLHGKQFECLKFRTMVTGADKIQEKLRVVSQVDGPQFKMADDPRISTVGRFLRETYIDEIPQFFNVLLGQMSIVGPRPSPESENTSCPFWRDARLSIRPGITGLWQVHRTRKPMKDFQEWIHYDIEYVRNLSLRMDLWVCWLTTRKLFGNFISQF